ncbi:right-handed parallel beta-helix repeat-containing protein [Ekhidna sp.]|uniref:right-handed parallel beta-helix repeat-containing protein n=1 Tax=Ekhidna sp. TaxID=2608089 RepID=UPI003BAD975E
MVMLTHSLKSIVVNATCKINPALIKSGSFFLALLLCSHLIFSQVVINEVVTDPQQDWSTNGFDGTDGASTIDSNDDWIELYITGNGLDLTGWTIELNDGTDESGTIAAGGAFTVMNYISGTGGSFTDTDAGDYIVLGEMTSGAINQSVTVVLRDNAATLIDQVIIAAASGTMFTGNSADATDESVCRIPNGQDTDVEVDDFVKTRATLGVTNSPTGTVLINEVVTNPRTDWSTNDFDGTDGGGTISEVDEWIELYIGTDSLNLTKWTFNISDSDGAFNGDLTSTGAFDVVNYIGSGDFTQTAVGDYLVLGNPDGGNDMNTDVYIQLFDADGTMIDDVEIGDNEEGDAVDDGAPNSFGSSVADESVARISNASDTDVDATDFQGVVSTLGTENGLINVFVDASATDDTGLGTVGDPKQLIQSGIDLALTTGTVTVAGGTYTENLTISKSLTLNGANQGTAGNGTRVAESQVDPGTNSTAIVISANDVTIDGIQVGTDASTSNSTNGISATISEAITITNSIVYANSVGVSIVGSSTGTVSIANNLVSMLAVEDATNATSGSIGIILSTISGDADANVTGNDITNAGIGISTYALTSTTEAVIDGGTYTGCTSGIIPLNTDGGGGFSPSALTIQNITMSGFITDADVVNPDTEVGVYVVAAGGTTSDDLSITMDNLDISGVGNGASNNAGIIVGDFPTASDGAGIVATITNCNIHDNSNRGIYTRGEDAVTNVLQSSITGNGFDPHATGGNPGFSVIAREASSTTVSNCFITNPATLSSPEDIPSNYYVSGLHISTAGSLTVSDCSLNDNSNGLIAETAGIDLSGNYFSTTTEATIDAAVGSNDFTPWLALGTDTDLGTDGFQGDFSSLIVGVSGAQTGSSGRIEEAVGLVDASGTIQVNAGTYAESLSIAKSLTLNGANQGIAGSGSRSAESIIEPSSANIGVTIGASDITVDGFQFGTDNTTSNNSVAISNTAFTGMNASNNVIYANSAGISVNTIASGTLTVSNNSIEMLNLEDPLNATNPSIGIGAQNITGTADADFTDNDIQTASYGFFGYNLNASPTVTIDNGNYTGCVKGIEIDNTEGVGFNPSTVNISNVTMSGFVNPDADVAFPDAQAGIYSFVSGSGTATDDITLIITGVDISGVGNAASDYSAIYLGDFASDGIAINYTITNSNIHDNLNRGIFVRGEDATANISTSTITGNGFDPRGVGGNPGFSVIARNGGTAIVDQCVITNAAVQSNFTTSGLHASVGGSVTVSNSGITNNGNGTIAEGVSGSTMNISGNWLGSSDETTIQGFLSSPTLIDITPWLNDGTDTDGGSAGFQGDFDALTVTSSGAQTSGARLQEGQDLVNASGTVTILQADYAETLTVSKDMAINPEANTTIDDITVNGGTLNVLADLEINNVLTLTSGVLDIDLDDGNKSDDPALTINNAVAGTFSATNHIEGKVETAISALGSFSFPVGDAGSYRPVTLSPLNATTFSVSHIEGATQEGLGTDGAIKDLIGVSGIQSVMDFRYWTIDVISGIPGLSTVTLQAEGSDLISDPSSLGMLRFDGLDWLITSLTGGAGTGPYTVTATTASFSDFSMLSTDASANPLPVELLTFSGKQTDGIIELAWSTLSEINADKFQVERKSLNEEVFSTVGVVLANGNTNERSDYQFVDSDMDDEAFYYRLNMVDFDGSNEYSPTILVMPELGEVLLRVFPNPASDYIEMDGAETKYIKKIAFYDLNGKLQKNITHFNNRRLPISDLPVGHYILRIELIDGQILEGELIKN